MLKPKNSNAFKAAFAKEPSHLGPPYGPSLDRGPLPYDLPAVQPVTSQAGMVSALNLNTTRDPAVAFAIITAYINHKIDRGKPFYLIHHKIASVERNEAIAPFYAHVFHQVRAYFLLPPSPKIPGAAPGSGNTCCLQASASVHTLTSGGTLTTSNSTSAGSGFQESERGLIRPTRARLLAEAATHPMPRAPEYNYNRYAAYYDPSESDYGHDDGEYGYNGYNGYGPGFSDSDSVPDFGAYAAHDSSRDSSMADFTRAYTHDSSERSELGEAGGSRAPAQGDEYNSCHYNGYAPQPAPQYGRYNTFEPRARVHAHTHAHTHTHAPAPAPYQVYTLQHEAPPLPAGACHLHPHSHPETMDTMSPTSPTTCKAPPPPYQAPSHLPPATRHARGISVESIKSVYSDLSLPSRPPSLSHSLSTSSHPHLTPLTPCTPQSPAMGPTTPNQPYPNTMPNHPHPNPPIPTRHHLAQSHPANTSSASLTNHPFLTSQTPYLPPDRRPSSASTANSLRRPSVASVATTATYGTHITEEALFYIPPRTNDARDVPLPTHTHEGKS